MKQIMTIDIERSRLAEIINSFLEDGWDLFTVMYTGLNKTDIGFEYRVFTVIFIREEGIK